MQLYSGYHALVVGCGEYKKGWPRLPNPVKDATEVADALRGMGWKVNLLENPEWSVLRRALNKIIIGAGREKDKAILFWFSGHGHTLKEVGDRKLGYIVPVDAPDPDRDEIGFMEHAISMRQIETVAKRIQAKHALMLFDSCFSGAIFNAVRAKPSPFIEEKVSKPVRQFITAGNENEQVPDQSVFKEVFLQAIKDGYADRNKDGYVTGLELGDYLQEQVVNYSRKAQHPQFGKINDPKLDKGDFIFQLADSSGAQIVQPTRTERKAILSITADVRGARVIIDGENRGTVPLTLEGLKPGRHTVRVSKNGYEPYEERVLLSTGQKLTLKAYLEPVVHKGIIKMKGTPTGAKVYIDGYFAGNIPCMLTSIEPGTHTIEVKKGGYLDWDRVVTMVPGKTVEVRADLEEERKEPSIGGVWKDPVTEMEFVWVKGGCYEMGCGSWTIDCDIDEKPVHEVCVDGFWMGKYEVTQGQWEKVRGNNPSHFKKGRNHPVERISWNDTKDFIRKLTDMNRGSHKFRLPTEAEWEYACRSGGKKEKYAGGDDVNRVAWYNNGLTHQVGTKAPNGLGIYDMTGNVWEWCGDIYSRGAYRKHQRNNPIFTGGGLFRVLRGGSWGVDPRRVRCANRIWSKPGSRDSFVGFRLVRTD